MTEKDVIQKVIFVIQTLHAAKKVHEGVSQDFEDGYTQALADTVEWLEDFPAEDTSLTASL